MPAGPRIVPVVDEGLGNSSYVVELGDAAAAVVDPFRDPVPYLRIAETHGWRIRFALETHLHADFVTGSRELAAATGARIVASAGAPPDFDARLLADEDELDLGGLTLRALATPGHTPEHLAYLLLDQGEPAAVFTGGTLIVGGAARPDLLGPAHTEALARATYRSLHQRLLSLPDELAVYPTHGAGSLCSPGAGGERASTIGRERAGNPLLRAADEDAFVQLLLGRLGTYPPYFLELREVNRRGPSVHGPEPAALPRLAPDAIARALAGGAELVDVRAMEDFAHGHVPGALSNPLREQFATWLGWLVDRRRPLLFVADERTDRRRLTWAALSIGYDNLLGELGGGMDAWRAAGRPVARIPLVEPGGARGRRVVDVRLAEEWRAGHLAGARHVELGALREAGAAGMLPEGPVLTQCGHGERAMTAASLLARAGVRDVAALAGGPQDLAEATGRRLETAW